MIPGRKNYGVRVDRNQRQCSPCTACCDGWLSAEIRGHEVRPGKPCPYSTAQGCSIYTDRPQDPCRNFVCSWLVEKSPLPDWMRPDLCGAIVLLSMPWHDQLVSYAVPVGALIPHPTLEWLKQYAATHSRPLLFFERTSSNGVYTGLKRFGFGPPAFRQLVADVMATESTSVEMRSSEP